MSIRAVNGRVQCRVEASDLVTALQGPLAMEICLARRIWTGNAILHRAHVERA